VLVLQLLSKFDVPKFENNVKAFHQNER